MLQDVHSAKTSIGISAAPGTNIIIAGATDSWIYIHELMGDMSVAGNLTVMSGANILATFTLDAGQGLTESDEPGNDNVARFKCAPGEDFILVVTVGTFVGTVDYSRRY